jgi:diguanylate cyclase (GGDEF)-like protein
MASEPSALTQLIELIRQLQKPMSLERMLQLITDRAAVVLGVPLVGLRLLDATGTRLLATCRSGQALHINALTEFQLGEGLVGWVAKHGQSLRSGRAEEDPRFAKRDDLVERIGSFLGVPLMSGERCMGVLSAVSPNNDHFTLHHEELLTLMAAICAPHVEISRLERLARVDPLTGVLNRRGLEVAFTVDHHAGPSATGPAGAGAGASAGTGAAVARAHLLSVALGDVDHFKNVNDTHGHGAGDEVLKRVAQVLASTVRVGDRVVRFGGEEFLLILPGVGAEMAARIADRARTTLARTPLAVGSTLIPVTISMGVAERRDGEDRDSVIQRADAAMYRAKQGGRNRIELAGDEPLEDA